MSHNPFQVVRDFERVVGEYTGAPYVVSTNSCTMALLLAVAWHLRDDRKWSTRDEPMKVSYESSTTPRAFQCIEIPRRSYLSVPMSIIHAGGRPIFRDEDWKGAYQLKPLPVWDSARWFTSGMFRGVSSMSSPYVTPFRNFAHEMVCTSHHWTKTLGIQQGGCILLDDPEADAWLRRARFDGRTEGVAPKDDKITQVGFHCYMAPEVAALGLVRMSQIPRHNEPLPNDDYPDLSTLDIFK